jgi:hypothetical protein
MFILAILKFSSLIMRLDAGILALMSRSFFRKSLDAAALVISLTHTAFLGYLFFIADRPFTGLVLSALVVLGIMLLAKIWGISTHKHEVKRMMRMRSNQGNMMDVEGRVVK